jgi:ABC-type branched-subunit amino acid transport system permease subunit
MDLVSLAQTICSGLANGALYAFVGLSFSLVSRSTGVINFAQGDLTMLGGMLAAVLTAAGVPLIIAVPLAALACAAISGGFYYFAIRPLTRANMSQLVIITVGLSILIRGVVTCLWGTDPRQVPPFTAGGPISIWGVSILPQQLWLIGTLVVVTVGTALFFKRTVLGLALRAGAVNPLGASFVGIDSRILGLFAFAASGLLGGLVGAVWSPIAYAQVDIGVSLGIKGFTGAILGGMATAYGPIVGGVVLAIFEALTAGYVSSHYEDALIFGLLILALVLRPQGLLGGSYSSTKDEKPEEVLSTSVRKTAFTARDFLGIGAGIVFIIAFGLIVPGLWISNAIFAGIQAMVVIGLVLLTGYAGQLSLGQSAFMMIGAYASAYLTVRSGWPPIFALLVGVALSAAVALIMGRIIFRLRGFYLSMASLGLLMIALTFAREWFWITGGPSGFVGVNAFTLFGVKLASDVAVYYTVAGFAILSLLIAMSIARSRIGRALLAIRSSESAARACGVDVVGLKMRVFAFSAATASVAGSLYGHYLSIVNPAPFGLDATIQQLTALTVGGFLSLWGSFIGSALTVSLPQIIGTVSGSAASQVIAGLEYIIFGVLLIGIIMLQASPAWYRTKQRLRSGARRGAAASAIIPDRAGAP